MAGLLAGLALALGACSSPTEPTPRPDAPTLTCPSDVAIVSKDASPVTFSYTLPTAIGGAPPTTVACTPLPGSSFPPGTSTVSCTATDSLARTATCGFSVKVSVPPRLQLSAGRVPPAITFMAFGDSMTAGKPGGVYAFGVEDFAGSYPTDLYTALVARYTAQAFTMSKQGWSGETTAAGLARLPGTLASEHPQVVLLMEGANDLSGGNSTSIAPAVNNVIQMVSVAQREGNKVFLATLPPVRPGLRTSGGYQLVPTFNAAIKTQGTAAGATIVDVYLALNTDPTAYISGVDGLHPTLAGYQKIADTFFASVQATMEVPGTTPSAAASVPLRAATTTGVQSSPSTGHPAAGTTSAAPGTRRPPSPRDRRLQ